MKSLSYVFVVATLLIAVFASGCSSTPVEEISDNQTEVPAIEFHEGVTDDIESGSTGNSGNDSYDSNIIIVNPDSLGMDTRVKYRCDTWGEEYYISEFCDYRRMDIGSTYLLKIVHIEGKTSLKIYLNTEKLTPPYWEFTLIDQNGETHSPINKETGDILEFEVPGDFDRDYSFLTLDMGNVIAKWSLAPYHRNNVVVIKEPYGTVRATFQKGSGNSLIKDITLRLFRDDGQIIDATMEPIMNAECVAEGIGDVSERVQVFINTYSGKQYLIFDEYVKSRVYM